MQQWAHGETSESTQSVCPICKRVVEARIFVRDNCVLMHKECPQHGPFEALLFGDAALYAEITRNVKPGRRPLEFATTVERGCPHDCGLCPEHGQHTCVGLIEINSACDLDCPLCFADAGARRARDGFELTMEQVEFMLDRFVAAEGSPEVLQFSGGEPTLHPQLLDFVRAAQGKGIECIMINTNGLRLAYDDNLLAGIGDEKCHIYLQFDGFDPATNLRLRGRPDLLETKLRALDRMGQADLRVVLVAAIERGINDHEVGAILELALRHPAVFGVNFQPVFRAQRHLAADPLTRITIPDVTAAIEAQTGGLFRQSDFVPVPCCAPTCHFVTYALLDGDRVTPVPRLVDIGRYLGYFQDRTLPRVSEDLVGLIERLWSASAKVGSGALAAGVRRLALRSAGLVGRDPEAARLAAAMADPGYTSPAGRTKARCPSCQADLPMSRHGLRDLSRHVFLISIRDFMDPWTFDVRDVHRCCVEFLVPDGRLIPFCAYNVMGYREQVREMLCGVKVGA